MSYLLLADSHAYVLPIGYNAKRRIDPYPPRTCATCGQEFIPVRRHPRYCRPWCREHAYLQQFG